MQSENDFRTWIFVTLLNIAENAVYPLVVRVVGIKLDRAGWKRDGERLTLDVTVPVNTSAVVHVPAASAEGITESGRPAAEAPGVRFLRMENGKALYEVVSGTYRFQSSI